MYFKDKIVVIVGGSSGIGEAAVKLFCQKQAIVYNLDKVKPQYCNKSGCWFQCDVTDFTAIQKIIVEIISLKQQIDYLFISAGIYFEKPLIDTKIQDIQAMVAINLLGTIYTLKAILPFMQQQRSGNIVLTGSDLSFVGRANSSVYSATKGAILQLTKSVALEYAADNIRVNCICPGAIATPLMHKAVNLQAIQDKTKPEVIYERIRQNIPLGRLGEPEEVAHFVLFLCSPEASLITGAAFCLDGGVVAK